MCTYSNDFLENRRTSYRVYIVPNIVYDSRYIRILIKKNTYLAQVGFEYVHRKTFFKTK